VYSAMREGFAGGGASDRFWKPDGSFRKASIGRHDPHYGPVLAPRAPPSFKPIAPLSAQLPLRLTASLSTP
jgi:hypothetical protein